MQIDELGAWLRLLGTPGIGRAHARKLLLTLGTPDQVWATSVAGLASIVGERLARELTAQAPNAQDRAIDATLEWLANDPDRAVLTVGDPRYPASLLESEDPPLMLYVHGNWGALQHPHAIAIVGSRNPTPQGAENARAFAKALSEAGVCVISGLALGIDGAAHEGALAGPAPTVAVVATGLDRVYPRAHHALARRITEQGIMVSEYPIGTGPLAANFPQRNRIIAGLSHATLVVEAALASGSLITAEQALQMGRDVLAIPGSIHSPQSKGCHALIRQGAKLVESVEHVLEELQGKAVEWPKSAPSVPQTSGEVTANQCPVLSALGFDPCSFDHLQQRTGLDTPALQARLLEYELDGWVARLPGGLFQRCMTA